MVGEIQEEEVLDLCSDVRPKPGRNHWMETCWVTWVGKVQHVLARRVRVQPGGGCRCFIWGWNGGFREIGWARRARPRLGLALVPPTERAGAWSWGVGV